MCLSLHTTSKASLYANASYVTETQYCEYIFGWITWSLDVCENFDILKRHLSFILLRTSAPCYLVCCTNSMVMNHCVCDSATILLGSGKCVSLLWSQVYYAFKYHQISVDFFFLSMVICLDLFLLLQNIFLGLNLIRMKGCWILFTSWRLHALKQWSRGTWPRILQFWSMGPSECDFAFSFLQY